MQLSVKTVNTELLQQNEIHAILSTSNENWTRTFTAQMQQLEEQK